MVPSSSSLHRRPRSSRSSSSGIRWPWVIFLLIAAALVCSCTVLLVICYTILTSLQAGTGFTLSAATPVRSGDGAASVASDFMSALKAHRYLQAYQDLGDVELVGLSADDFERQARHADACGGSITAYQLSKHVAVEQEGSQHDYTVLRGKLHQAYRFTLVLRQSARGAWGIVSYGQGNMLIPAGVLCQS
ncbi:MAG TPA: hypothetical protein VFA10_16660 [Ktedonobacteraceae bacterium]|nr:hypothetical protein [Ktedonobacteraceae bacterium]